MTDETRAGGSRFAGANGTVLVRLVHRHGLFNAGEQTSMSKLKAVRLVSAGVAEFVDGDEAVASMPTAANVETLRAAITRQRKKGEDPFPDQPKDEEEFEGRLNELAYGELKRMLKAADVDIGPNPKKAHCIEALMALRFAGIEDDEAEPDASLTNELPTTDPASPSEGSSDGEADPGAEGGPQEGETDARSGEGDEGAPAEAAAPAEAEGDGQPGQPDDRS